MRQLIVIIAIVTLVSGCKKSKEKLEKFTFENSQIAYRDVHNYTYNKNGKIAVDRRTSYKYMAGVLFDSSINETIFQYSGKGQVVLALDLPDSSRQIKIYNNLDSLIGDYRINEFGDTTHLAVTVYDEGNIVRRINRNLRIKLPENRDNFKKEDLRNYDTILFETDLIYNKGIHVKSLFRDNAGMLTEEIEQFYEANKRIKTISYAFFGETKYLKETTYYQDVMHDEPDFVSIGTKGDTIAIKKTLVESNGRVVLNYNREFEMQNIWYYDNTGQLVAIEMVDLNGHEKTVSKYTYDNKGNKIEEITYREKLNNAH